jgi:hypothetical protein
LYTWRRINDFVVVLTDATRLPWVAPILLAASAPTCHQQVPLNSQATGVWRRFCQQT